MNKQPFLLKMYKENNGRCREKNEKLCKVKACRKINLYYDQKEKLENKYKLHFENLNIFFKKANLHKCPDTPPPPVRFCSLFNDSPLLPASTNVIFK